MAYLAMGWVSPAYRVRTSAEMFWHCRLFELQELIDNEEKILELVREIPQLSLFAQERENLSAKCVELASECFNMFYKT